MLDLALRSEASRFRSGDGILFIRWLPRYIDEAADKDDPALICLRQDVLQLANP